MQKTGVRFEFSLFVPGIRLLSGRGLGPPKPLGKGSIEPWKRPNGTAAIRNGRTVPADTKEVYDWVNKIAEKAAQRRNQLIAQGYDPFPYRGPVKITAIFLYERPATQRGGYPTHRTVQHDLDKLQRAVGDAIDQTRNPRYPLGDIIEDDSFITTWVTCKRFVDQVPGAPGAGVMFMIEEEVDDRSLFAKLIARLRTTSRRRTCKLPTS